MRRETGITDLENCNASKKNMSTEISFKITAMTSFGGWGGGREEGCTGTDTQTN